MTYSNFARPKGAKDKQPRKKRRKTRIEAGIDRKVKKIKRIFEPEPTKLEKLIDYVKNNPMKSLGAATAGIYGAGMASNRIRDLVRNSKYFRDLIRKKPIEEVAEEVAEKTAETSSPVSLSEFARPKGARDKKKRKKRFRRGLRVRAIDKDKIKQLGENEVIKGTDKSEVDPKVKEAYLKAQTFRSRLSPIIQGVREARSAANMLGKMSSWNSKGGNANFYDNQGMPVVEDLIGKQIKGRGGIVKLLAHHLGSEKTYNLEYNPKEYDSSQRYYERYATLLADNQGNLSKSKDVGGKPNIHKSQVKGQQGIEAKKGKVGGSMLRRQYSSDYDSANFEESRVERLRARFRKLAGKGKRYVKEKAPKVKAYAGKKYSQAKERVKKAKLGTKVAGAAMKGAYNTGRYAEKASQAKKRIMGD